MLFCWWRAGPEYSRSRLGGFLHPARKSGIQVRTSLTGDGVGIGKAFLFCEAQLARIHLWWWILGGTGVLAGGGLPGWTAYIHGWNWIFVSISVLGGLVAALLAIAAIVGFIALVGPSASLRWVTNKTKAQATAGGSSNMSNPNQDTPNRQPRVGDESVVVGPVPPGGVGNRSTIIGPVDGSTNVILNRGGIAIGADASADSTGIAIGTGANAGNNPRPAKP